MEKWVLTSEDLQLEADLIQNCEELLQVFYCPKCEAVLKVPKFVLSCRSEIVRCVCRVCHVYLICRISYVYHICCVCCVSRVSLCLYACAYVESERVSHSYLQFFIVCNSKMSTFVATIC
jgi:hypothetical protein